MNIGNEIVVSLKLKKEKIMKTMIKIATVDAESQNQAKRLAEILIDKGFLIARYEEEAYRNTFDVLVPSDEDWQ